MKKIYDWLEYKRRVAVTIANLKYRLYMNSNCVPVEEIIPNGDIHEFHIREELIENSLREVSEKWENYYAEAVYYALLSKSTIKLIFTPKSKLERILEETRREYRNKSAPTGI